MQTTQEAIVSSPVSKTNFRSLLSRLRLGPRGLKISIILFFTLCWLLVVLVRSNVPRDITTLDASSLIGLATSLQQGSVSGRDFQSILGPGAQLLGWVATAISGTGSPLHSYDLIAFLFCMLSAVLIAVTLLLCNRFSWQDCAISYGLCFLLNLGFDVLDFRSVLLLLVAVFTYRIIGAETMRMQIIWATGTGLLSFAGQLITFELGIYAAVVVICTLIAGSILTRNGWLLLGIEVFVATLAGANIGLVVFFKLTSPNYRLAFDYQNYSFEILRAYHNSMGTLWQLPAKQTIVLVLVACYVIARCFILIWKSDPLDASLLASLTLTSGVWVTSAFVSSDIPHITVAFTPMILVLGLLTTRECQSRRGLWAWALIVCGLFYAWPAFNFRAPLDILQVARREVGVRAIVGRLYAPGKPLEPGLRPTRTTRDLGERSGVPVLAFPYDNHIAAGIPQPFFAPVLESYAASTESLERYYIQALIRQRRGDLDIIYGTDGEPVPSLAGIQAITRTPRIFEYLYSYFELVNDGHTEGHHMIRERHHARELSIEELRYFVRSQSADSGTFTLSAPATCPLLRLQMRMEYTSSLFIFRPSGTELTLKNADQVVWKGVVSPLEPNETFMTYISPLPPAHFPQVYSDDPIQSAPWDSIEYRSLPSDMLGAAARRIHIEAVQCVNPRKVVGTGESS